MILLTVEEIIYLEDKLIKKTGGSYGLRDRGLLESAVYSVDSSFDGTEKYKSLEEKAARLMFSLTNNHAFVDGNKRIGVLAMLVTLSINGVELKYTKKELVDLSLKVANGEKGYNEILEFINKHK